MSFCICISKRLGSTAAVPIRAYESRILTCRVTPPAPNPGSRLNAGRKRLLSTNSKSSPSKSTLAAIEFPRKISKGWSSFQVFSLVAATGALGYWIATNQAIKQNLLAREYSNPMKFLEPKYASIQAMELVSKVIPDPIVSLLLKHRRPSVRFVKSRMIMIPYQLIRKTLGLMDTRNGHQLISRVFR